jgi:hypothetical protein
MWFDAKTPEHPGILIARIKGERRTTDYSYSVMATIGFLVMLGAIILESSAVRLAAWGAIWTGWNVLCAMGALRATRTDYLVYRIDDRHERREPV